jgi:ketosteroid isomerase-like protein
MAAPEDVIRRYVEAMSSADEEAAADLAADDVLIALPSGEALNGNEGARLFAAKHAETDGQKRSVALTSLEARTPDRFLATLEMTNREVETGELLYSLDVGSIFELRDGLVVHHRVFPSADEAAAAV